MNNIVLTDTGFWLGLLDPKDQYHSASNVIAEIIEGNRIVFPWPCLYETLKTRLIKRKESLIKLEQKILKPGSNVYSLLDDKDYKDEALRQVFQQNRFNNRNLSLTDCVIREILKDSRVRVDYFITFNAEDFIDICNQRNIKLIDQS